MKGLGVAHGAVSIVNAISIGKGAALGICLKTTAEVKIERCRGKGVIVVGGETSEDTTLAEMTVQEVLKRYGEGNFDVFISTKSEIPVGRGLKSSSAASNAIVLASLAALDKKVDDLTAVNIGVDASLKAGVTITGAFDDACASFFGGFVVTDNTKRKLIQREKANDKLQIVIYVPTERTYTKDFDKNKIMPFKNNVAEAYKYALSGEYWKAMILNGDIHSSALGLTLQPSKDALGLGALGSGLSGTGPAVAAVCYQDEVEKIRRKWCEMQGEVIVTSINNSKAEGVCFSEG